MELELSINEITLAATALERYAKLLEDARGEPSSVSQSARELARKLDKKCLLATRAIV